ncbi:MAG: hypothetical protein KBA33_08245, partial [Cloacibacterium sp.]|nr:hypothetical protein [Cloacibacterium sp.]
CEANGVTEEETKLRIWSELEIVIKPTKVKTKTGEKQVNIEFAEDLRRLKRLIKRELLKLKKVA